jgi:polyribonucleotide nucleotidyltransferase
VINKIIEEFGVTIDIEDTGLVFITGQDEKMVQATVERIKGMTEEVEIGKIYQGVVRKIMDFGAFVDIMPGQSGLVHISKFVPEKIASVKDVVREGDKIPVKVTDIDSMGRINLSAIDAGFRPQNQPTHEPRKSGFFKR